MKTTTLFAGIALTLSSMALQAAGLEGLGNRRFEIINAESVSAQNMGCILALRSTISERDAESRNRYDCFGLEIKNATIRFDNGEIAQVDQIKTQPMMELLGTTPLSEVCSERIASSMDRFLRGEGLEANERLNLPSFQAFGIEGSTIHVATASNTIRGHEIIGRSNISYNNKSPRLNCSSSIKPSRVEVAQNYYERPSEDRGVLGNIGRSFRDLGVEAVRGTENVADSIGGFWRDRRNSSTTR
jgi:hypothetical protein